MEWEKKFYDIVRETESNLTNARRKLQGGSTAKPINTNVDFLTPGRPLSATSYQPALSSPIVNSNDHINSIRRQIGWSAPSTPLPAVPTSLSTGYSSETRELLSKIDSQNLMIEKLERLVRTLNQEKDQYRKQIRDLQNEVGAITSRLNNTQKQIDPHLEAQVDLMRYEVRSDLQRLQNMISSSKTSSMYTNSLERSFKDMQQNVHSDLEELRREVNSMTQRVGRLELDVSTHSANHRDLRDRLKNDSFNKSTAGYLYHSSSYPSTSGDVFQMRELRSTIAQFHDKLDRLESRLAASRATPATQTSWLSSAFPKSPGRAFKSTPKMTLDDFLNDDDDDDDDINSDLELDLSSELDLESNATEDLSDDLDKLVNAGKTSSAKTKFASGSKSPAKDNTFSAPTSDHGNSDSEAGDLLSDLDLNNLDLGSAGSEPADIDSLEAASVDLKVDDL